MDVTPALAVVLDGITAAGGGRSLTTFRYLPWGRHWDTRRQAKLLPGEALITIRRLASPKRVSDMGGGASLGRPVYDVHAYWQETGETTDPDAFFKAVVDGIEARIHLNEKTLAPASFVQPINSQDLSSLLEQDGTAAIRHEVVVTLEAFVDEVYGA